MGWSERQVAMLDEMGIRVWSPPEVVPPVEPAPSARAVAADTPAPAAMRVPIHRQNNERNSQRPK
jgi:DNA polymerase